MTQAPHADASTTTKVSNEPFFSDKFKEQMQDAAKSGLRVAAFAAPIVLVAAGATALFSWFSKH